MSSDKPPHIMILMTDQLRADFTSMENHPYIFAPNLEELSRNGVYFHNAYTPSPVCVPARQAIMSGQYPGNTGCRCFGDDIADDITTFPAWLGENGYATISAGKLHLQGPDQLKGWHGRIGMEHPWLYSSFESDSSKWIWRDELKKSGYGEGFWNRHDRYAVNGALIFLDQYFAGPDYDRNVNMPLLITTARYRLKKLPPYIR